MIDQYPLLVQREVFSRPCIRGEHTFVKADKVLDDRQLKIKSRFLEDPFGVAELNNHALLPFADGKGGLCEDNDDNKPEADKESGHDALPPVCVSSWDFLRRRGSWRSSQSLEGKQWKHACLLAAVKNELFYSR